MRFTTEIKVGFIVFLAIVAAIGTYAFLSGRGLRARAYEICALFNDVQRLEVGADVRMAGVKIGTVRVISLTRDNKALVTMRVLRKARIPQGSAATITSGAFIGDTFVEIIPGEPDSPLIRPGVCLAGRDQARLEQIVPKVDALLDQLQTTVQSLNKALASKKAQESITSSLGNLETATREAARFMSELHATTNENRGRVGEVIANAAGAVKQLQGVIADLRGMTSGGARRDLEVTLENVRAASADLQAIARDAHELLGGPRRQDIDRILENVKSATANLDNASTAINKIAADEKLAADLRAAVENAREATQQAKELATKINRKIGDGESKKDKPNPVRSGLNADVLERFRGDTRRVDLDYTLPWRDRTFYRVGMTDLGESNGVNLQAGLMISENEGFRYGFHASRAGVGYDRRLGAGYAFTVDLFRPNDPDMEFRLVRRFAKDWQLVLGMDRCFDDASPLLGIGYSK